MSSDSPQGHQGHRGYLLLRRGGVLWGIDNAVVSGLTRRDRGYCIAAGDRALMADEILCVVDRLNVRSITPAMLWLWPGTGAGVSGMAVHGELPLVVVDPRQPPRELWLEEGDGTDVEQE